MRRLRPWQHASTQSSTNFHDLRVGLELWSHGFQRRLGSRGGLDADETMKRYVAACNTSDPNSDRMDLARGTALRIAVEAVMRGQVKCSVVL